MSNAFMKLEEQLAAAQAEVVALKEKAEQDWALNSAALAEIAALRRVLAEANGAACAELCERLVKPDRVFHVKECREAQAALSAPSAAEPLLADIRAAVEELEGAPPYHDSDCSLSPSGVECDCWIADRRVAAAGLRRWVP